MTAPSPDIPALTAVDPRRWGIAFACGTDGGHPIGPVLGAGEWRHPFSLQSLTKVFALARLMALTGDDRAGFSDPFRSDSWGEDFRSTSSLDGRQPLAPNPFTNAGALVVVDRLLHHAPDVATDLTRFLSTELRPAPDAVDGTVGPAQRAGAGERSGLVETVTVDERVAGDELSRSHRNRALAHLLAERGLLDHPVDEVLEQYVRQCAISASCATVARAAVFLSRGGRSCRGGRVLSEPGARRLNALILTSGAYRASGRVAVEVGLPVKTGVGGGVLAVAPGRGVLCAWSPGLDVEGNPSAALTATEAFVRACGFSIF